MEIAEHIDALRREGDLLADAAERAGLDATVPPCPSWQVRDLLRHTGYIHRWATRHVVECPDHVLDGPPEEEILRGGAPDPELLDWFRAGHVALVETLTAADPALECATFMPARPRWPSGRGGRPTRPRSTGLTRRAQLARSLSTWPGSLPTVSTS
jgi:uncharacterized protein (TIGR03083 family)